MRLIFAIPGNLASLSGGYRYAREIIARLPSHGIDVIHCKLPGTFPEASFDDVQEAIRAVNAATSAGDMVLFDGLAYGAFPEAAAKLINAPIIALVHHPLGFEAGLKPERSRDLLESEKKALARAVGVIVTSPFTARTIEQQFAIPAARIFVARPGTEPAVRANGSNRPLSLLAAGSITPRKAYATLIEALSSMSDIAWRLRIAGSKHQAPETVAALETLINTRRLNSRVELLGEVRGAALDRIFHESDVFVSSSLYEGYGMALAEALRRGLPIVAAAGGAAVETVPENAALMVPPGNSAALGEALRLIILDRSVRKRLSDASWHAGQSLPSWNDTAGSIACILRGRLLLRDD